MPTPFSLPTRLRLLAGTSLALVCAAGTADAQESCASPWTAGYGSPFATASVTTTDVDGVVCETAWHDPRAEVAVTHGGASARAYADMKSGRLGVRASGSTAVGSYAAAMFVGAFTLQNTGTSLRSQDLDVFLDGVVRGANAVNYPRGSGALAHLEAKVLVRNEWDSRRWDVVGSIQRAFGDAEGDPQTYRTTFTVDLLPGQVRELRGYAYVNAIGGNGITTDFANTARLFVPSTPGVVLTGWDGFLSEQAMPAWALPQSTVPEPSSLALGAGGLAALAVAARRKRSAR